MSTLTTSNLSDGTTTVGTEYVVNGSAKAWADWSLSGNTIEDSFNITSLTDNGTGRSQLNLTNAMASTSYSRVCSGPDVNSNTTGHTYNLGFDAFTASYITFYSGIFVASGVTAFDSSDNTAAAWGDLA